MKILFWMSGGFDKTSTSRHLLEAIIGQLVSRGHEVSILRKGSIQNVDLKSDNLELGIKSEYIIPCKLAKKNNFMARYLADYRYVLRCKKYIKKKGYDVIFLQSSNLAGIAVRKLKKWDARVKIAYNVQDIFPYNAVYSGKLKEGGFLFKRFSKIQRYAYQHVDSIITISEDMKDLLVLDGANEDKISVIYNWSYQDGLYQKEQLKSDVVDKMFPADKFNVVYAGNIGVMQNAGLIVKTAILMQKYIDVQFHIIGNGLYKKNLMYLASKEALQNITFWDMQPPSLAPVIYSSADINIIPLIQDGYKTALPSKTATCLACQQPIIFAIGKQSKFAQWVHRETGCPITDYDDSLAIKDAILEIKKGCRVCNTGDFFLQHCSKTRNSARYADIIDSII